MKILVLSSVHISNDVRIYHKQIRSLIKHFGKISYMTPLRPGIELDNENLEIIGLPKGKNLIDRFTRVQLIVLYKLMKEKPSIIHFHDPELLPLMYLISFLLKVKIIFDVHENIVASFDDKLYLNKFWKKTLKKYYSILEKKILNRFDKVIIAENSYAEFYPTDAEEILNYPLLHKTRPKDKNFEDLISFIYTGNITELRGVFKMLEIFRILKHTSEKKLHLHLIGDFYPTKLEDQVKEFIRSNELQEFVTIYGRRDLKFVYEKLEQCHIGLSLLAPVKNHEESLPTKIFEYMMFGLPVVVSNFDLYKKYVSEPNTGILVDYGNVQETSSKIAELLNNSEMLKTMSLNGRKMVENKWNWKTEEKKLIEVYKNLIEQ